MPNLAVLNCAQLVTMAGPSRPRKGPEMSDLGLIARGAMLVRGGVISRVGPQSEIESLVEPDDEIVDAGGGVVLPGFVDAHTHLVFGGNRVSELELKCAGQSYEDIAAQGGGIMSTVRKTRDATEEELFDAAARRASWLVKGGTTTAEVKSGYGLSVEAELKMLRVAKRLAMSGPMRIVPTFLGAHAVPEGSSRPAYVDLVAFEMLPAVAREGLARYADIFVEHGYFETDDARRIADRARSLGLGMRLHCDQLRDGNGAALAAELQAVTADHLEHCSSAGIEAMAQAGVQPVLLPASVLCLGSSRYPAARAMIDRGLAVVLGSDFNPGSSPAPSMPLVQSLACYQMRMTPAEALTASTINAACSLGLGSDRGTLEPGKLADFAIWDCEDYREIAYWVGAPIAPRVFIGGVRSDSA